MKTDAAVRPYVALLLYVWVIRRGVGGDCLDDALALVSGVQSLPSAFGALMRALPPLMRPFLNTAEQDA